MCSDTFKRFPMYISNVPWPENYLFLKTKTHLISKSLLVEISDPSKIKDSFAIYPRFVFLVEFIEKSIKSSYRW